MKINKSISAINASEMRDALSLILVTETPDGEGGYTASETVLKSIFAKVEPRQESRVLDEAQLEYTAAFKIYCRYDTAIDNKKLLQYRGLKLTIHSCINISGLNQFLEIIAYTNG